MYKIVIVLNKRVTIMPLLFDSSDEHCYLTCVLLAIEDKT